MLNPLIDLYQYQSSGLAQVQSQANLATVRANRAHDTSEILRGTVEDLKRKADALTITCQALWEIVRTQSGLSDDAILKKMEEIDARDGRVDGKISARVQECPKCRRNSNVNRRNCLYCGTAMPVENVFEKS